LQLKHKYLTPLLIGWMINDPYDCPVTWKLWIYNALKDGIQEAIK